MFTLLPIFKQHPDRSVLQRALIIVQFFNLSSVCHGIPRIHGWARSTNSRMRLLWQFFDLGVWGIKRIPTLFRPKHKLELTRLKFQIFKYRRAWSRERNRKWRKQRNKRRNVSKNVIDSRVQTCKWTTKYKILIMLKPWQFNNQRLDRGRTIRTETTSYQLYLYPARPEPPRERFFNPNDSSRCGQLTRWIWDQ